MCISGDQGGTRDIPLIVGNWSRTRRNGLLYDMWMFSHCNFSCTYTSARSSMF